MQFAKHTYNFSKWILPKLGFLSWIDQVYAKKLAKDNVRKPPLFIVGAPRTGTTILYQTLLTHYPLTYFSNVESMLFTTPVLSHRVMHRRKDNLENKGEKNVYGYVKGLTGPSEAGALMRYFLENGPRKRLEFDTRLQAISAISQRPVLSKNTFNSFRLDDIYDAIPDAFVIWITRENDSLQRSIMRMRQELGGDSSVWIGAGKPDSEILKGMSPEEQVQLQITLIADAITRSSEDPNRRLFKIAYEDFCEDKVAAAAQIMKAYSNG